MKRILVGSELAVTYSNISESENMAHKELHEQLLPEFIRWFVALLREYILLHIITIVLKKTLESISFDFRRGSEPDEEKQEERMARAATCAEQTDACIVLATE